jgi:hypothetical protein
VTDELWQLLAFEPAEHVTYSNGVRKAIHRDVDGIEIGFGASVGS